MKKAPAVRIDGSPVLVIITDCCGARQYDLGGAAMCMLCGKPLTDLTPAVERSLDHLRHHTTRYWS